RQPRDTRELGLWGMGAWRRARAERSATGAVLQDRRAVRFLEPSARGPFVLSHLAAEALGLSGALFPLGRRDTALHPLQRFVTAPQLRKRQRDRLAMRWRWFGVVHRDGDLQRPAPVTQRHVRRRRQQPRESRRGGNAVRKPLMCVLEQCEGVTEALAIDRKSTRL